ncbi:MAG TPA: MarC family protein [Anaeromyxobacteraceae bacterium]|nr:MarC family protein [Anaeromyxobacteraceae bacterium]
MLAELTGSFLVALSALFFVVDPIAAVPFFLAVTRGDAVATRRSAALRASVTAFVVLAFFALAGAAILSWLGVTLAAFKIAGGVVLLLIALDMIRTQPSKARITDVEVAAGAEKDDPAIVPLAMPLLAGPGSIATSIVLMTRAHDHGRWQALPLLLAIAVTCIATYFILAGAARTERVLGRSALAIVERAAGLLLVAVAIQFILDGVGEAFPGMFHRG